jgi:urease beta subunit
MCRSRAICSTHTLLVHYVNPTKCIGLVQRGHHYHLFELNKNVDMLFSAHDAFQE